MESRHEDILSEIKLGDPQSTLATARQCNIIPDLLKVPMKDEVSLIYIIIIYIYMCVCVCVLWNEKRGHQLVPLKRIKEVSTPPLFMLCQQNCSCMQNDTSTMLISNLD